jgi:hypothetical protein
VKHVHRLAQTLLVHGALDGDVRQRIVDGRVRLGLDGRVERRVLVVLLDGPDDEGDVAHEQKNCGRGREQWKVTKGDRLAYDGDTEDDGEGGDEGKARCVTIERILLEQNADTGETEV